jgi:hypothetical protein
MQDVIIVILIILIIAQWYFWSYLYRGAWELKLNGVALRKKEMKGAEKSYWIADYPIANWNGTNWVANFETMETTGNRVSVMYFKPTDRTADRDRKVAGLNTNIVLTPANLADFLGSYKPDRAGQLILHVS